MINSFMWPVAVRFRYCKDSLACDRTVHSGSCVHSCIDGLPTIIDGKLVLEKATTRFIIQPNNKEAVKLANASSQTEDECYGGVNTNSQTDTECGKTAGGNANSQTGNNVSNRAVARASSHMVKKVMVNANSQSGNNKASANMTNRKVMANSNSQISENLTNKTVAKANMQIVKRVLANANSQTENGPNMTNRRVLNSQTDNRPTMVNVSSQTEAATRVGPVSTGVLPKASKRGTT